MGWAVPYLPTPPEIVRRMLKIARVGSGDVVYDLGCGDGYILIMAVKEFGADRAVGYEIREDLCRATLAEVERQTLQSRVKLMNGDLFDADLHEATVITLYLDESTNQRLKSKLERTAKVSTRIVSYAYKIKGWKPTKKIRRHGDTIYLYTVPESINQNAYNHFDKEKH
jgi:predicted RNA methylase